MPDPNVKTWRRQLWDRLFRAPGVHLPDYLLFLLHTYVVEYERCHDEPLLPASFRSPSCFSSAKMVALHYVLFATILKLATANNGSASNSSTSNDGDTSDSGISITPERFQAALDRLPDLCQRAIDEQGVPGLSVAVVYNGEVRYTGGFGVKEVGKDDPVSADTVFQLASVSKPIASTIVAAIVDQGFTTWDSHINSPSFIAEYYDPYVTADLRISDGFTHRSGMLGTAGDDLELFGYDQGAIFAHMKALPPVGPFRITYSYSNYGLTSAAVSASTAAGKEWADAAQEYLYDPLGMSLTSSRYSDFLSRSDRSSLHMPALNSSSGQRWMAAPVRTPDAQSPAGGVSSNVNDLAKWLQLHLGFGKYDGNQLISESAINQTVVPQIVRGLTPIINQTGFYAFGWDIDYEDGQVWQSHAGAFSNGARTLVKMNRDENIGILILANAFPTGWPEGIADSFFDMMYYGDVRRDYPMLWNDAYSIFNQPPSPYSAGRADDATPMLPTQSYTGRFYNDYTGVVEITAGGDNGDGDLAMSFPGSSNTTFNLKHWSRDTFYISELQDDPGAGVSFFVGADGNSTGMSVDYLNPGGAVLTRAQPGQ